MSGTRLLWPAGAAITDSELQLGASAAASADDLATANLLTPGSQLKRVYPVDEESASLNPSLLVQPSATKGVVSVRPSLYVVGSDANTIALSAVLDAATNSPTFAANTGGAARYDLLYVSLARVVPSAAMQGRKYKSPADGGVSTQTLNLWDVPTLTLGIFQGCSLSDPLASLPADTSTTFYFGLARVTLAAGFDPTATSPAQSAIAQLWQGGFVATRRRRVVRPGSIMSAAGASQKSTLWPYVSKDKGSGGDGTFAAVTFTGAASGVVLDSSIDWRGRKIAVSGVLPAVNGGLYSSPELVTKGGSTASFSGVGFSGTDGSAAYTASAVSGLTAAFYADASTGALKVNLSGTPNDAVHGDGWYFEVTCSENFVALATGAAPPY